MYPTKNVKDILLKVTSATLAPGFGELTAFDVEGNLIEPYI